MPAQAIEIIGLPSSTDAARFIPVMVTNPVLTDVAIIRTRFPGILTITGVVTLGTGSGTALTGIALTRATDYNGNHVVHATGAAIVVAAANPAILQITTGSGTTAVGSSFQMVVDASAGHEFKIQASALAAGVQLEIDVQVSPLKT